MQGPGTRPAAVSERSRGFPPASSPCFPETVAPRPVMCPQLACVIVVRGGRKQPPPWHPPEGLMGMPGAGRPARVGSAAGWQKAEPQAGHVLQVEAGPPPPMLSLLARAWIGVSTKLGTDGADRNVLPQHTAAGHSGSRDIPGPTWVAQSGEEAPHNPSTCSSGRCPLSGEPQLVPTVITATQSVVGVEGCERVPQHAGCKGGGLASPDCPNHRLDLPSQGELGTRSGAGVSVTHSPCETWSE